MFVIWFVHEFAENEGNSPENYLPIRLVVMNCLMLCMRHSTQQIG